MSSNIEKKKEEKNPKDGSKEDDKNKGIGPFLINLLKKLIYLLIFSFISLGILMSTQINKNIKSRIPNIVTDFTSKIKKTVSNPNTEQGIKDASEIERLERLYKESGPVMKWLSTTYNKTFQADSDIYAQINKLFGSLFSISILDTKKINSGKPEKQSAGQALFSIIFTSIYFFLSPILALLNAGISGIVNFIAPFYYNYEYSHLLFGEYNIIIAILIYILFQYINLFSDSVTSGIGFWGTLSLMIFEPYLYNGLAVARKYIVPGNDATSYILDIINVLLDDKDTNYNYWKTKGVPMIKKIAPVLVNLFLIYAASSSSNYLPSQVSIGLWVGVFVINIPIILSLFF
jgi:hypothetical protein